MSDNPIRTARKAKELKQRQLAEMVGVTRETVARWESNGANARQVDRDLVPKVSAALGLPAKEIRSDWAGVLE